LFLQEKKKITNVAGSSCRGLSIEILSEDAIKGCFHINVTICVTISSSWQIQMEQKNQNQQTSSQMPTSEQNPEMCDATKLLVAIQLGK
jgi:hypothetical protein